MFKKILTVILILIAISFTLDPCFAKGGFSSGAGRGGFSGGGRSFSSGGGGGFRSSPSVSRSYSSSSSYSAPRSSTVTRTTTTRYYGGGSYYHPYYHPMMMYPGFGMGYGYSNGLIEGLIIGNMMHPAGTVPYTYGGYDGNALLYPDGRVVDSNGYQVGNYTNGQYVPVQNGQMVAQPAPQLNVQNGVIVAPPSPWHTVGLIVEGILGIVILVFVVVFVCWLLMVMLGWIFSTEAIPETIVETTTETETVTTREDYSNHPTLKRKQENGQYYVIDPVDNSKTWLNSRDDLYEDAANNIWRLVD